MDPVEQHFSAFAASFDLLELVGLVFLVAIVSETVWDFLTGARRKLNESFANYAIALVNTLLERTVFGLVFVAMLVIISYLLPYQLPVTWWSWALAVLVADFSYYWMHRWEHEVRVLWAYHSVHHSSPEYNLTTALRLAWVEGFIEWIFFVPMILVGFDVVQSIVAISIVVAYQTWIHTEKVGKLGWADKVFNTPSVHRVHHGSNSQYLDKNYGGILIIWDRLFGTYQAEDEPVTYGITTPLGSSNPVKINFHEFLAIARDVKRAASWREALGYVFNRPGWQPPPDASP